MKFNGWLIFGIIGIFVFGIQFGIFYSRTLPGNSDIWWTPRQLALPIYETAANFEIYINGELLQLQLERGSLMAADSSGELTPLTAENIEVRLNNWHKIRADYLHIALFMALGLGAALMSLAVGIVQLMSKARL